MIETFNPAMIVLARESRGMNQKELAEKISISVSNISKMENSALTITPPVLEEIADATNYPTEFFYQKTDIIPDNLGYRRRQVVSQKILVPINAQINIIRQHVQFLTRELKVPVPKLPIIDVSGDVTPQMAAKQVRKSWKIKEVVIANLTQLLESHKVAISTFDFNTARVDSRSILTEDNYPLIVHNRNHLGDRQRFTLAHELGHFVMHTFTDLSADRDITHEANLFAAELLMPEAQIRKDFKELLTITRLAELKKKWNVSMISILYRADDLGFLSPNQKHYLIRQFNALNIRRREPVELDVLIEKPKLIRQLISEYKTSRKMKTTQMAATLHLTTDEFVQVYG